MKSYTLSNFVTIERVRGTKKPTDMLRFKSVLERGRSWLITFTYLCTYQRHTFFIHVKSL
jgi:hypothetical protein